MAKKSSYTSEKGNTYSISGGHFTGYSFTDSNGKSSVLGFDNDSEVKSYIEQRENGKEHFMDDTSNLD